MTIKEEIQIEEYKRTFAEAYKQGFIDAMSVCKTEPITEDCSTVPTSSKMEQVDEPQICDTCRYYNSNIPCGTTPDACKKADKFAEEFVDGLKKLKPKVEPQTDNGIGCSRCEGRFDCYDRDMPNAVHCNNYGKITDEPQKERCK